MNGNSKKMQQKLQHIGTVAINSLENIACTITIVNTH